MIAEAAVSDRREPRLSLRLATNLAGPKKRAGVKLIRAELAAKTWSYA